MTAACIRNTVKSEIGDDPSLDIAKKSRILQLFGTDFKIGDLMAATVELSGKRRRIGKTDRRPFFPVQIDVTDQSVMSGRGRFISAGNVKSELFKLVGASDFDDRRRFRVKQICIHLLIKLETLVFPVRHTPRSAKTELAP